MCGISLCFMRRPQQDAAISRMVSALRHRGPDSDGTFFDVVNETHSLALGHNRLSIIDLTDHASQPMMSEDRRYVLIYNGEVYNYRELMRQFEQDELPEGTVGDTAVVLASLIKWGPAALEKFNGMWALALYDTKKKTLLISRDRFGKKPLYYSQTDGSFYLASEVKAVLSGTGERYAINPRVAVPYLTRGLLDVTDETFFEGITQFPAASYQVIDLTKPARIGSDAKKFWTHPFESDTAITDRNAPVDRLRELFIDSVRLRLRSDVPVGVLLSGGVDSSSIVGAVASLAALDNVTVLSVISDEKGTSEEPFIDEMSRFAGCATQKVNVSNDPVALLDTLGDVCWFNDEPPAAVSSLAHMDLMKRAAENGIKVLLTGQGADEQLGGYNKFLYFYLYDLFRRHRYSMVAKTLALVAARSNTLYEFRLSEAMRYVGRTRLAQGTFIAPGRQPFDSLDIGFQGSYERREWIDVMKTSIPALLHAEDRLSMSQSLEMRVPFLDYRLVELLAQVSPDDKFEGGRTKSIFRKAIKGLVPDKIRHRRDKKGFNVPVDTWMRGAFEPRVKHVFNAPLLSESLGFVDAVRLNGAYGRFKEGKSYLNGRHFFRAYAFELFLRRYESSILAA